MLGKAYAKEGQEGLTTRDWNGYVLGSCVVYGFCGLQLSAKGLVPWDS